MISIVQVLNILNIRVPKRSSESISFLVVDLWEKNYALTRPLNSLWINARGEHVEAIRFFVYACFFTLDGANHETKSDFLWLPWEGFPPTSHCLHFSPYIHVCVCIYTFSIRGVIMTMTNFHHSPISLYLSHTSQFCILKEYSVILKCVVEIYPHRWIWCMTPIYHTYIQVYNIHTHTHEKNVSRVTP